MSEELPRELRCVLVPVGNLRLLLPNAVIAEVITQAAAEPVGGAPPWLLGRIAWRGQQVPLVSFARLAGAESGDAVPGLRVAVLNALGGNPQLPFVAIHTHGFPRLTTLNSELIIPTHDGKRLPPGVRAHVLVRDDVAVIPDLEWIESALLELLATAALATAAGTGAETDGDHAVAAIGATAPHRGMDAALFGADTFEPDLGVDPD